MPAPPALFDRALIARRLERRSEADFVTALVRDDLGERLAAVSRSFEVAAILGPDAALLPAGGQTAGGPVSFERISTLVERPGYAFADPEALALPRRDHDLIVSQLDLQMVTDVPGYLARIRAHLRPDGLFLAATVGGGTLNELRAAWLAADAAVSGGAFARVAPFIELRDAGALLQRAGFALPVADVETHTVRYSSPLALMQELQAMGASNPLADRPGRMASRALLRKAMEAYAEAAADADGRVRATLHILWLSGWAPHESQQQPLKPGSATVSLTKVLKDRQTG